MSSVVLKWYRSVRTRVVDLVGDYAGKELFLLEGDSLLLECFQDKRLDFEDGFQLLHAVYIVETFLENLIKRKCNFRIIFFDAHAELCIPLPSPQTSRSRYLLARSAIIHHLISHLSLSHPALEVAKFPTFNCPAFRHYLDSAGVYFVMCHDGSKARELPAAKLHKSGEGETTPVQDDAALVFRGMIFWLMMLGLNVALVNEVEWRDSKIFARVVDGGRHKRQHAKDIANLLTAGVAQTDAAPGGPSIRSLAPLWDLIKLHGGSYSERDYLTVFCLSEMLKQGSVNPSLASAVATILCV